MDNVTIGYDGVKIDKNILDGWKNKNNFIKVISDWNNSKGDILLTLNIYKKPKYDGKSSFMRLQYKEAGGRSMFRLSNSLRKWYFSNISRSELDEVKFKDCLCRLSEILSLDLDFIFNLNVYKLEIGRTLLLPLSAKRIMFNVFDHPYFKNRNGNFDGSIYLNAEHIGIIMYDKLKEMSDKNHIKKNTYEKIGKHKALIRIELRIKKISGVEYANKNFRTVSDVYNNWELLTEYWKKEVLKINFIDFMTDAQANRFLSQKSPAFVNFFTQKGVEIVGADETFNILDSFIIGNPSKKSYIKGKLKKHIDLNMPDEISTQNYVEEIISNTK